MSTLLTECHADHAATWWPGFHWLRHIWWIRHVHCQPMMGDTR
jgi:hypothetical protein